MPTNASRSGLPLAIRKSSPLMAIALAIYSRDPRQRRLVGTAISATKRPPTATPGSSRHARHHAMRADTRHSWHEIERAGDQTLTALSQAISMASGFNDPHLWSFLLSSRHGEHSGEAALSVVPDTFDGRRGAAPADHASTTLGRQGVPPPARLRARVALQCLDAAYQAYSRIGARRARLMACHGQAPTPVVGDRGRLPGFDHKQPRHRHSRPHHKQIAVRSPS